jgi:hypothetical protein
MPLPDTSVLDQLIDHFLTGRISFDDFATDYSRVFIDDLPDDALSPEDLTKYGDINEIAELTTPTPTDEDRQCGWITITEFKEWLEAHR